MTVCKIRDTPRYIDGFPVTEEYYQQHTTALPEKEKGTVFVVSAPTRRANPKRYDLASPGGRIVSDGEVIGCTNLVFNPRSKRKTTVKK